MDSLVRLHALYVWALIALESESIYLEQEVEDIKISGGRYVLRIQEFSYMISVLWKGRPRCGGSLLNSHYVLTACHCVVRFENRTSYPRSVAASQNLADYKFVAGTTSLNTLHKTAQVRRAAAFLLHPECKMVTVHLIDHDIGLAKAAEPFTINDFVKPINLFSFKPSEYDDQVEAVMVNRQSAFCTLAGYMLENRLLMGIRTYPYPWDKCSQDFPHRYAEYRNTTQILCALGEEGEGTNIWDTGAAWVCDGYLMGIFTLEIAQLPLLSQKASTGLEWLAKERICSPQAQCRIPTKPGCGNYCLEVVTLNAPQQATVNYQLIVISSVSVWIFC